jgi:hypothetical protein
LDDFSNGILVDIPVVGGVDDNGSLSGKGIDSIQVGIASSLPFVALFLNHPSCQAFSFMGYPRGSVTSMASNPFLTLPLII